MIPAYAKPRHGAVLEREARLKEYFDEASINRWEAGDEAFGVVTAGTCYPYVREVLPKASVLKLGASWPLPEGLLRRFCELVERVFVVEELEPVIEKEIRALGFEVDGKRFFPRVGELGPEIVRAGFEQAGILPPRREQGAWAPEPLARPPVLCAGCPHISSFMAVRASGARVAGDIGCYTLACLDPLRGIDTTVSMGSSIGNAIGMAKAGEPKPIVATIGDSTFLHAGIPGLIDAVYNHADLVVLLLDNHVTAMTGGQNHPGTGKTLRGEEAPKVDYEALVRAVGVTWVRTVDSYDLAAMYQSLREAIAHRGVAVLIANRPCVLDPVKIKGPPLQVVGRAMQCVPGLHESRLSGAELERPMVRRPAQDRDRPVALHRLYAVRASLHGGLHQAQPGGAAMSGPRPIRASARRRAAAAPIALADPSREPLNVLVVGVGGQGVIMVSKLLALLAQKQGYEVKQSEVHGMAKRGGAVFSHVRFGRRVWSPTIPKGEVDVLIALEWAEGLRWLPYLKPDTGIFICDTKRIVPPFACRDRRPGAAMRYARETPAEVIAHVARGIRHRCDPHGGRARQRACGQRRAARCAVYRAAFSGRRVGAGGRRIRAEEDRRGEHRSLPARALLDRAGARRLAPGRKARGTRAARRRRTPPIGCASRSLPHGARAATSA